MITRRSSWWLARVGTEDLKCYAGGSDEFGVDIGDPAVALDAVDEKR